jgi:hypothetical protein
MAPKPAGNSNQSRARITLGLHSGSPVLSASHKVLALHHLGDCLNEDARMSLIYPQISSLIDNGTTPPPDGPYFQNTNNVTISDNPRCTRTSR